jgi:hypothetical protein
MSPSDRRRFVIDKRLHAEANAIESEARHGPQHFFAQLAGSTFQRHLSGIINQEHFFYRFNYVF